MPESREVQDSSGQYGVVRKQADFCKVHYHEKFVQDLESTKSKKRWLTAYQRYTRCLAIMRLFPGVPPGK